MVDELTIGDYVVTRYDGQKEGRVVAIAYPVTGPQKGLAKIQGKIFSSWHRIEDINVIRHRMGCVGDD